MVIILSVSGGSWAICAGDFVQLLILMAVSIATAVMVLGHEDIGGINGLINKVPTHHFDWSEVARYEIILFWIIATFVHKFVNLNNMQDSYRYLNVKDERSVTKGRVAGCSVDADRPGHLVHSTDGGKRVHLRFGH